MNKVIHAILLSYLLAQGEQRDLIVSPPIQLAATSDTFIVHVPVMLTVTLTNNTDHDLYVPVSGGGAHAEDDYSFKIERIDKKAVALSEIGRVALHGQEGSKQLKSVRPGESVVERVEISKFFDMLQPGEYLVTATRTMVNSSIGRSVSNTLRLSIKLK